MITAGLLARARPRSPRRRTSSGTACRRRTRRRRCRPSCRPGGCRARGGRRGRRPRRMPRSSPICASEKPWRLAAAQQRRRSARSAVGRSASATSLISSELVEEPRVDLGGLEELLDGGTRRGAPACTVLSRPSVRRRAASLEQRRPCQPGSPCRGRTARPCFSSERSAFCSASVKVRPMAIASPTDFMCVVSVGSAPRELLEGEPRHLDDDVVERRLEGGRRLPGDVVGDLVEGVADGQLGGDLGDREAGGLRGQRRGARDARVHLDDDHAGRRRG